MAEKFRAHAGDSDITKGGIKACYLTGSDAPSGKQYLKMLLGTVLVCLCAFLPLTQAQEAAPRLPELAHVALNEARLEGAGEMRFWGLRIYDARLWAGAGFEAERYQEFPLALDLTYHRDFRSKAIAQRSVQEIQRQGVFSEAQSSAWEELLTDWMPDVQAGDRLVGLYLPGYGLRLWHGEQALGWITDPELARRFVGIWLAPQTSEPSLRLKLLGQASDGAP